MKKIKVTENGPYIVKGSVPLYSEKILTDQEGESRDWERNKTYNQEEVYALCRCGKSLTKPFCDGSHAEGFEGTETASKEKYVILATKIEGPIYDLLDQKELCADARFCHPDGGTWNLVKEVDVGSAKKVVKQCSNCPSGRYTPVTKEGAPIEPNLRQEIVLIEDPEVSCSAPIFVKGGIEIEASDGNSYPARNRVTLCRCGQSQNKPFCDGSHISIGFRSDH